MKKTIGIRITPEVRENGIVKKLAVYQVYLPKTNFKGGNVKWLEDKPRNNTAQ